MTLIPPNSAPNWLDYTRNLPLLVMDLCFRLLAMAENTKGDGALIQPILAWGCERFFDVLTVYARIFARNFAHRCAVVSSYLGPMYTMFNGVRLLRNLPLAQCL